MKLTLSVQAYMYLFSWCTNTWRSDFVHSVLWKLEAFQGLILSVFVNTSHIYQGRPISYVLCYYFLLVTNYLCQYFSLLTRPADFVLSFSILLTFDGAGQFCPFIVNSFTVDGSNRKQLRPDFVHYFSILLSFDRTVQFCSLFVNLSHFR